eukprot:8271890-Pyramimonas_sp.AAC.1
MYGCSRRGEGRWQQAMSVLREMCERVDPNTFTAQSFNAFIWTCAQAGQWQHALSTLGAMRR